MQNEICDLEGKESMGFRALNPLSSKIEVGKQVTWDLSRIDALIQNSSTLFDLLYDLISTVNAVTVSRGFSPITRKQAIRT